MLYVRIRRVMVDARVNYSGNLILCDNLADSIGIHPRNKKSLSV